MTADLRESIDRYELTALALEVEILPWWTRLLGRLMR